MKALHLSAGFEPVAYEAIPHESFVFHGGEPHIKLNVPQRGIASPVDSAEEVLITQRATNAAEFMLILLATDALRRAGYRRISLLLPYFPAARQDRPMVPGEPLSIRVYADLINAQNFERVIVFDPHSDVTPALLNNVEIVTNQGFIEQVLTHFDRETVTLIAPDAGAAKKIHKLAVALGGLPVVLGEKVRDVRTGALMGFQVFADILSGRHCLIVDDICDGGGTFVGLAAELRKLNPAGVSLAVSHGIFSKGFAPLTAVLDRVFTTDSFKTITDPGLTQLPIVVQGASPGV